MKKKPEETAKKLNPARKTSAGKNTGNNKSKNPGKSTAPNKQSTSLKKNTRQSKPLSGKSRLPGSVNKELLNQEHAGIRKSPEKKTAVPGGNVKKAAMMLVALGEEQAAEILRHFDPHTVEKIATEIIKIKGLEQREKEDLLLEFRELTRKTGFDSKGGLSEAEKFLERTLGKEAAQKHMEKVKERVSRVDFSRIEEYQPETVARLMANELPQSTALLLSHTKPSFAAKVFTHFTNEYRTKVARKIATLGKSTPEVVNILYENILKKLEEFSNEDSDTIEGESRLAEILNFMDRKSEDQILQHLAQDTPELAERVKEKLHLFEDIMNLNHKEIRKLFNEIPDLQIWAKALKGAGQEIIRHILSSVSANRSGDIIDEMNFIGAITIKEIEQNRRTILNKIVDLENKGELFLRKDKEEFVE